MNLYQILYALSEITGEPRYADQADGSLKFFFAHCQSPATGLLCWGEHAGWDLRTEKRIDKPSGNIHEFYRPWVLWERSWQLAPKPCRRFALGARFLARHPHLQDFARSPTCALVRVSARSYYLVKNFQNVMELHISQ